MAGFPGETAISDQSMPSAPDLRAVLKRAWAVFLRWRRKPIRATDHDAVIASVCAEGDISARYNVMVMLSCGIAILGLLLSSPAVIIGAMLISPLMGPIMQFGFSLAILDWPMARRGIKALALGTLGAVALSALIVWLSPLNAVTPEILARTRPNFFDLLVAILSAVAGAYAVIKQKGATIVGVAIATALMPPLAVVGYGLATANWAIFGGALGLYLTNMLAISLTSCLVAKFFGFGLGEDAKVGRWQTLAILGVFAVLSVPLGLSLRQLASEALLTSEARSALEEIFPAPENHIYGVNVNFPRSGGIEVEALVLTQQTRPGLEAQVQKQLTQKLNEPVSLSLSQAPVNARESVDRQAVEEMMSQSNASLARQIQARMKPDMAQLTAGEMGVTRLHVSQDSDAQSVMVRLDAPSAGQLIQLHAAQQRLAEKYPGWRFIIRPQMDALPPVIFAPASDTLDADATALVQALAWTLTSNTVQTVEVTGYSDSSGSRAANRRIAAARARAVGDVLEAAGLTVHLATDFPATDQRQIERQRGLSWFRKVRVAPAQAADQAGP